MAFLDYMKHIRAHRAHNEHAPVSRFICDLGPRFTADALQSIDATRGSATDAWIRHQWLETMCCQPNSRRGLLHETPRAATLTAWSSLVLVGRSYRWSLRL